MSGGPKVKCGYCGARFLSLGHLNDHYARMAALARFDDSLDEHDGVPPRELADGEPVGEPATMTPELARAMAVALEDCPVTNGFGERPQELKIEAWVDGNIRSRWRSDSKWDLVYQLVHGLAVIMLTVLAELRALRREMTAQDRAGRLDS